MFTYISVISDSIAFDKPLTFGLVIPERTGVTEPSV